MFTAAHTHTHTNQQVRKQEKLLASQTHDRIRQLEDEAKGNLQSKLKDEWIQQREQEKAELETLFSSTIHAFGEGHQAAQHQQHELDSTEQQYRKLQQARQQKMIAGKRSQIAGKWLQEEHQRKHQMDISKREARQKAMQQAKQRAAEAVAANDARRAAEKQMTKDPLQSLSLSSVSASALNPYAHTRFHAEPVPLRDLSDASSLFYVNARESAAQVAKTRQAEEQQRRLKRQQQQADADNRGVDALTRVKLERAKEELESDLKEFERAKIEFRKRTLEYPSCHVIQVCCCLLFVVCCFWR